MNLMSCIKDMVIQKSRLFKANNFFSFSRIHHPKVAALKRCWSCPPTRSEASPQIIFKTFTVSFLNV